MYQPNRALIEQLDAIEAGVSVFTFLELCGASSFRLSRRELETWLVGFPRYYPVHLLDAHGLVGEDAAAWWTTFVGDMTGYLSRRMSFGDAVLLREAERYAVDAVITWNTRDFAGRTSLRVVTPTAFLRRR